MHKMRLFPSSAFALAALMLIAGWLQVNVASGQEESNTGLSIEKEEKFGQNAGAIPKVWGGAPVVSGAFPAVVGVSPVGTRQIQCTGTLIERDVVLTAAHCSCAGINRVVSFGNKEDSVTTIRVKASKHALNSCGGSLTNAFDIAVLLLASPSTVTPISIQEDSIV